MIKEKRKKEKVAAKEERKNGRKEGIAARHSFVSDQNRRLEQTQAQTDRQTDGQTDEQTGEKLY